MTKLKIGVDLDGVIWDIMNTFVDIYNKLYKEDNKVEDIDDWYYFPQERWEVVYPLTLPRIMEYPILDPYIPTYLYLLNKIHDVSIITKEQNPIGTMEAKLETLGIRKGREYNEIIKLEIKDKKLDYPFNVFIDDYPGMAKDMDKYPEKILLFYDQPWNKKNIYKESGNVLRVRNWKEILLYIKQIELIMDIEDGAADAVFR